ncbi:MAG: hypothetical protein AAGN82_22690 [Myxococcota bacterium]
MRFVWRSSVLFALLSALTGCHHAHLFAAEEPSATAPNEGAMAGGCGFGDASDPSSPCFDAGLLACPDAGEGSPFGAASNAGPPGSAGGPGGSASPGPLMYRP